MNYAQFLSSHLESSIAARRQLAGSIETLALFGAAVACIVAAYRNGGRPYIAGNGGSAADAQHLVAEFVSKLVRDRNPLPVEALTVDSSVLTAIGNDYGFARIFTHQLYGKARPNDVFLGITTSGNSANIVEALQVCRQRGIASIVFTGFKGGHCASMTDYCIIAPGDETAVIQELHIVLAHAMCACVGRKCFLCRMPGITHMYRFDRMKFPQYAATR